MAGDKLWPETSYGQRQAMAGDKLWPETSCGRRQAMTRDKLSGASKVIDEESIETIVFFSISFYSSWQIRK